MDLISAVGSVVAPVFLIAGLGYLWRLRNQPFDTETIGSVVMMLGSPCLIYTSLTSNTPGMTELAQMAGAATILILCSALIAWGVLRMLGWSVHAYLPTIVQPNGGNMGLPVCLLAFGEAGLALGMAFFFVNSISQYTLGLAVSSGQFQPGALLRQPVIWAVLFTLFVIATDTTMPKWFNDTSDILGGLTIPAMLLMLGTSLVRLKIENVSQTLVVAALRFFLGLALGWAAIWLFDLSGILAGVVLLQSTMPSAVFNFVFAERFDRNPDQVAAVVFQSTLLSVVTLPLMITWAWTL